MLSKRTHPMIGKISELLIGGVNVRSAAAPFLDALMTSPRSPLDFKILPQISQRNSSKRFYDDNLGGSVGLGIVAALENSTTRRITSVCRSDQPNQPGRSDPVQFMNHEGSSDEEEDEEMFVMDDEDYTLVTCHNGPSGSCSTRVYDPDGIECFTSKIKEDQHQKKLFMVDVGTESPESSPAFQGLDFLNSCYLCRKKLHGHDIFIYRGEKAFCSTECRSSHIANDERKKRSKSKFSTSPYTAGQIFSTGVLVT